MTPSRLQKDLAQIDLVVPRRLFELLSKRTRETGMTKSEFIRRALASELGNARLADMPRSVGQRVNSRRRVTSRTSP